MEGIGSLIWFLLIAAIFGAVSILTFVIGGIASIWLPIPIWALVTVALAVSAVSCLIVAVLER